jgi:hypothetical protein
MHNLEPFYNWRHLYAAEEDEKSPFFGQTYNEFEFTQTVYNYYIHPQWDEFGSKTLYMKVLYVDYNDGIAIIELIGEWNDAIENDIMTLKRDIIDSMLSENIYKYIIIAENVLNFHSGDKDYYEEWLEDVIENGGWIVAINMPSQTQYDFREKKLNYCIELFDIPNWRIFSPQHLLEKVDYNINKRLK